MNDVIKTVEFKIKKEKNDLSKFKLEKEKKELERRKLDRLNNLQSQKAIQNRVPKILGRALVIPQGYLNKRKSNNNIFIQELESRKRIEKLSMDFVIRYETRKGHLPKDVSKEKLGWDIESYHERDRSEINLIEVKGLSIDRNDVIITRNEILKALNSPNYVLFIVKIDNDQPKKAYFIDNKNLKKLFRNPGFAEISCSLDMKKIISMASEIPVF